MTVKTDNIKLINRIGEFSDSVQENEFFKYDMERSIKYIEAAILILGILNTLFFIPDHYIIRDIGSLKIIAASRGLFLALIILLYLKVKHTKSYIILTYWITIYEFIAVLVFLIVFLQYKSPNFLIQSFGIITILLSIFIIPNRWIYTAFVSLIDIVSFIILSWYYVKGVSITDFLAVSVYIMLVIVLCCVYSYRDNYNKRINYVYNKELVRLSETDALTGIYNRAKFDNELKKWIIYSERYKLPLSLILIDIDNFKGINDKFGHPNGDKVIIELVRQIKDNIRETDIFARWGGEEFAVILPNIDINNAVEFAERLRRIVLNIQFSINERITCSFGVVQQSMGEDAYALVVRADQMLYSAKAAGKNIVKG